MNQNKKKNCSACNNTQCEYLEYTDLTKCCKCKYNDENKYCTVWVR